LKNSKFAGHHVDTEKWKRLFSVFGPGKKTQTMKVLPYAIFLCVYYESRKRELKIWVMNESLLKWRLYTKYVTHHMYQDLSRGYYQGLHFVSKRGRHTDQTNPMYFWNSRNLCLLQKNQWHEPVIRYLLQYSILTPQHPVPSSWGGCSTISSCPIPSLIVPHF
jgi:hypothetical protein